MIDINFVIFCCIYLNIELLGCGMGGGNEGWGFYWVKERNECLEFIEIIMEEIIYYILRCLVIVIVLIIILVFIYKERENRKNV